jgi:hypothetical protein
MDMTPPQAPPAFVSSEQQATIDTVGRLSGLNDWLIEQRAMLPALPGETADTARDDYLAALASFWDAPVTLSPGVAPVSRRSAFATQWAALMRDEATLRGADGTLDADDAALAAGFARSQGAVLPSGAGARDLLVGDVVYAGAMVLTTPQGRALRFMPDRGWDAFDDLDALHAETERGFRARLAAMHDLPGALADDIDLAAAEPLVASRERAEPSFEPMARRMEEVQRQKVAAAWDDFDDDELDPTALVDLLRGLVSPLALFDAHAVLAERDARLQAQLDEERMAHAPAAVREGWHDALKTYRDTARAIAQLRLEHGIEQPTPLREFARDQLKTQLKALGIDAEPDAIRIRVTPSPLNPFDRLFHGSEPSEMPLVDLALQNAEAIGDESFAAFGVDGAAMTDLDSATIRLLVRAVDAGQRYVDHLRERLLDGTEAGRRTRDMATRLHRARMRFEAADARVSTYAPGETPAFLDDHAERGYQWVNAALNGLTPQRRMQVEGQDVVVRQFTYRGTPIADVLSFGVRSSGGVFRTVVYTPDAPDGRNFREFGDRAEAAREFLLNPAFETYLLDRLPGDFTQHFANGSRHFKRDDAARQANWVLGQGNAPGQTQLDEPIEERDIDGDFLETLYDTSVSRVRRDVLATTRATDALGWAHTMQRLAPPTLNPASQLAASIATDVVRSLPRAFQAAWRAYDRVKEGDYAQAFVDVTESYTSALNVIGVAKVHPPRAPASAIRAARGVRTLAPTRKALADPSTAFEARFLASEVSPTQAMGVTDGIARIGGKTYVEQGSRMYHVRFDSAIDGWRLSRPGTLDSAFSGPAIARTVGGWRFRHDVGLRGGMPGGLRDNLQAGSEAWATAHARRLARLRDAAALVPGYEGMGVNQLLAAHRELARRRGPAQAIAIVHNAASQARSARPRQLLAEGDLIAWRSALAVGRGERQPGTAAPGRRVAAAATGSARTPAAARPAATPPRAVPPPPPLFHPLPGAIGFGNRAVVELEPHEWPTYVWHYMRTADVPAPGTQYALLSQSVQRGTGVQGLAVTTRTPNTPLNVIVDPQVPPGPLHLQPTLGSRSGGWVRVDLSVFRDQRRADGMQVMHVFRSRDPAAAHELFLRPSPIYFDPTGSRPFALGPGTFWPGRSLP